MRGEGAPSWFPIRGLCPPLSPHAYPFPSLPFFLSFSLFFFSLLFLLLLLTDILSFLLFIGYLAQINGQGTQWVAGGQLWGKLVSSHGPRPGPESVTWSLSQARLGGATPTTQTGMSPIH